MITEIRANARISFKQLTQSGDVFYTFEYGETIPHTFDQQVVDDIYKASDADCEHAATYYYSCIFISSIIYCASCDIVDIIIRHNTNKILVRAYITTCNINTFPAIIGYFCSRTSFPFINGI